MAENAIRWWQSLTTAEAGAVPPSDPVVILPLAAIEQHGPHLPLSTDVDIGLGLLSAACELLPQDFPVYVLPPQAVGCSREHARFPGTLTLDHGALAGVIEQVGRSLASAGVRRLVLSNSHGGNRSAMSDAGLRLRDEQEMLVVKTSWFLFSHPPGADLPEDEWRHGLHGGAVETAMMMHLRPDLVRSSLIRNAPSLGKDLERTLARLGPEGAASFSWLAGDLNPSGAVGDARLANAGLGGRLVAHFAAALADVIRDARAFPLERLV